MVVQVDVEDAVGMQTVGFTGANEGRRVQGKSEGRNECRMGDGRRMRLIKNKCGKRNRWFATLRLSSTMRLHTEDPSAPGVAGIVTRHNQRGQASCLKWCSLRGGRVAMS
jgi:hypothetical protein